MRLEWILLAEGLGTDAKGAITAIGLNQNVLVSPSLPATTKRGVLVHLVDEDQSLKQGAQVHFSLSMRSPTGRVLVAQSGQAVLGDRVWPDLPTALDIPAELVVTVYEYGLHTFTVEIQMPDGVVLEGSIPFYVRDSPPRASTPSQDMASGIAETA